MRYFGLTGLVLLLSTRIFAQELPFLWGHSWGVGARAVAMGSAYTALSDDYTGLNYNPAGLAQVRRTTLLGSFNALSLTDKATYRGIENEQQTSSTQLNALGCTIPFPTVRGSLALSFGYHRIRQFDNGLWVRSNVIFPETNYEAVWEHERIEEGAMSQTSFGGSIEVGPSVWMGLGLHIWGGEDDYIWQFREVDEKNLYTFHDSTSTEHIATEFSGINLSIGTLVNLENRLRVGVTLLTPVTLKAKEFWDYTEIFTWDDGKQEVDVEDHGHWVYRIRSPWIFRAGVAGQVGPVLVSGDIERIAYSQYRYTTHAPTQDKVSANLEIRRNLQDVWNYRVGGELSLPFKEAKLRAGYAFYPSPWKGLSAFQDRKVFSIGGGIRLVPQWQLDIAYAMTSWKVSPYDVIESESIDAQNLFVTLSYSF